MEIERKFLIDWKEIDALGLPLVKQAQSWQAYLSADSTGIFCAGGNVAHPDDP